MLLPLQPSDARGCGMSDVVCGCFPLSVHRPLQLRRSSSSSSRSAIVAAAAASGEEAISQRRNAVLLSLSEQEALPSIVQAKRVVLVRHGQSTWNEEGRIQGSSNFAVLTAKGENQAQTSRQMLLADTFDICFYSPLSRAMRTAEIIWSSRQAPMVPIDDLREIDLYSFQGLMKNEGKQRYGDAFRMWQKDASNFQIDGHFPVRELWLRAQKCWSRILSSEGTSMLVVAHNAVNQALVATAAGLGPEYFRMLLQSNCGVTVIDFAPRSSGDGPPYTCLERLNQTPSPPFAAGQSAGRKAKCRVLLVCHGATDSTAQKRFPVLEEEPLNMLGVVQSRKTAELLLDVRASHIFCSSRPSSMSTASAIAEVQEAADCLGADCIPRYVEVTQLEELDDMDWGAWRGELKQEVAKHERWQDYLQHEDVSGGERLADVWNRSGRAWKTVTEKLLLRRDDDGEDAEEAAAAVVVVVAPEIVLVAMLGHCLGLSQAFLGSFKFDTGSLSVVDFPDCSSSSSGRGVVRCLNYTAHLGRWAVPVTMPLPGDADEDF